MPTQQYFNIFIGIILKMEASKKKLRNDVKHLATIGITSVWLPLAFKASAEGISVGYDVYDNYDLGEFDQKGSVRTKYCTKQEFIDAIEAAHATHIKVYADIVVNHKRGANEKETSKKKSGKYFIDFLDNCKKEVLIDGNG